MRVQIDSDLQSDVFSSQTDEISAIFDQKFASSGGYRWWGTSVGSDSDRLCWIQIGVDGFVLDTDGGAPREHARGHVRRDPLWTHCVDSFCYLLENPIAKRY